ncbi:MAG: aminotransferase class V-fold PLP-dependent enzyme, partial [Actinomycetia bacterium]|nr:aminotransferase class V-fold PLP-dependent enzyme [Actinomycetes bacterium]
MNSPIDLERIRTDTPGAADIAHLNNAGSSLPPRPVVDAVVHYLRLEERMGGYETAAHQADQLDAVYDATARLLNCQPDEVAFTTSASDSWWRAFSAVPLAPGDRVLAGRSEFQTNAFGLLQARERGVQVDIVPHDADGVIDLEALDAMLDERVKLISLTHVSMSNGCVHPAAAVGERARAAGAFFLLDSCQAAGQLPLDVHQLGCDFLVYTGRKFMRGPRGTGILYARSSVLDRLGPSPFVDGRSAHWSSPDTYEFLPQAQRFEFGEQNYAGKVGLGVATQYALDIGIDAIAQRIAVLAGRLRSELAAIDGVEVRDEGVEQCGIVTFTVAGHEAKAVFQALQDRGVNVSAPGVHNAQNDLAPRGLDAVVRAGVHYFNTDADLDSLLTVVA